MAKKKKSNQRKRSSRSVRQSAAEKRKREQAEATDQDDAAESSAPQTSGGVELSEYLDEGDGSANIAHMVQPQQPPKIPRVLPVLPIRGSVMFPATIVPIGVGRPSSLELLEQWLPKSKLLALFTQKEEDTEEPGIDDLYAVGTVGMVLKVIRQPDDSISIIVQGIRRVCVRSVVERDPFMKVELAQIQEVPGKGKTFDAEVEQLRSEASQLIDLSPAAPEQAQTVLLNIEQPAQLADFLAANLSLDVHRKQQLLEQRDVAKRLREVHQEVARQLEIARLQQKIHEDVQSSIGESQRKLFLREQVKAIQHELGEDDDGGSQSVENLRERLDKADPPQAVMAEAKRELRRLESIPVASPEYSVITNYLELIADLPWKMRTDDQLDLNRAQQILDRDHFNLNKVKRRLIEYLAVRKLNPHGRGPILCLIGPPGVGKTSLGQSVADALGRKFARLSLGGIRDEAEIRGHRRTYIGAMPGRIIQELRRAGANNPVFMLDEVDKLGSDFRGDPTSALLEVLDPKQNNAFVDRYLDVPFDLSQCLFICTANYMGNIPGPLQDRLETIEIPGYTDHDKLAIARKYLVPRQLKENGLKTSQCQFLVSGLNALIEGYTREAGVRELERQIGAVSRGVAAEVAGAPSRKDSNAKQTTKNKTNGQARASRNKPKKRTKLAKVDPSFVRDMLGPEKYVRDLDTRTRMPGIAIGLAYTPVGGEILFIEATRYAGKGTVTLTGQIGDVMKESATTAMSLFKSRASQFDFNLNTLKDTDIHIHVPAGAVPKDGPSAGVAMYTALASLLTGKLVKSKVAMTGEVTLRGNVLPIGGVKEKSLAAARAGIKTILLPKDNERDYEEVDEQVKKKCKFVFVETVDEVLKHTLG